MGWMHREDSESFSVEITGGSVKIYDRQGGGLIKALKGYNYLYTGGIRPDESEAFALENGNHFFIFSLKNFEQVKRVTLPRTYRSIDVCGFYSNDGKALVIPAHRYIYEDKTAHRGHYAYFLLIYETESYTLIEKRKVDNLDRYSWRFFELLKPQYEKTFGETPDIGELFSGDGKTRS